MKKQFVVWVSVLVGMMGMPFIASAQVSVVTSIRPLALIAEEVLVSVEGATVETIVPQSASPHSFSLKPSHLKSLLSASALVWLGPSFEPYLEKAIAKREAQNGVLTVEGLQDIRLLGARHADANHVDEAHVEDQTHDHHHHDASYDPHLWWSSENALVIASALANQLTSKFPQQRKNIQQGLETFKNRISTAKETLKSAPVSSTLSFVVYHDSLVYLEQELERFSKRRVTVSPEAKPSIKDMLTVKVLINRSRVSCIIMEPNANQKFLQKVNPDESVRVVTIDPLGWDAKNYSAMWTSAANTLVECSQ